VNNQHQQSTIPPKKVTYAEQTASSLHSSIHAPNAPLAPPITSPSSPSQSSSSTPSTPSSVKGKSVAPVPQAVDATAREAIRKLTDDVNKALKQLAIVQSEFTQMKNRFDSIDNKLDKIVSFCNLSADPQNAMNAPIPVNLPTNPLLSPSPISSNRPFGYNSSTHSNQTSQQAPTRRPQYQNPNFNGLPRHTSQISAPSDNAVNRLEFSSAMGKVDQLAVNFNSITGQLAALTKALGGANSN
jgi:hypothetical protein